MKADTKRPVQHIRMSGTSRNGRFFTMDSQWLTATEAAEYLKVKPRTVLKWAKERCIPAHSQALSALLGGS